MADEMPADVRSSLGQLLAEARNYATTGDSDTAASLLESAHTVATNTRWHAGYSLHCSDGTATA